jgi:hypothetical protein
MAERTSSACAQRPFASNVVEKLRPPPADVADFVCALIATQHPVINEPTKLEM